MTLENFCEGIKDNSRVQCILDCPTVDGEKPPLIKYVYRFLQRILTHCFHRFVDDGHTSWMQIHTKFDNRHTIPLDIQKSSSWLLFHQALYHTYCHHDADGFATWTQILEGEKIWILIRPNGFTQFKSRRDLYEACVMYLSDEPDANGYYGKESERFVIHGQPGDMMQVSLHFFSFPDLNLIIDSNILGASTKSTHLFPLWSEVDIFTRTIHCTSLKFHAQSMC